MTTSPTPTRTFKPGDRVRLLTEAERSGTVAAPLDIRTAPFVGTVTRVIQRLHDADYVIEMDARKPRDARPVSATVPATYLALWPPHSEGASG